jgi:DNA-binding transcriptional MerR regulator
MKDKIETFSISQASQMTGVSNNRIRDWHDKGFLLGVRWISVGSRNHRRFTAKAIETIQRIDRYQKEGFRLATAVVKGNRSPMSHNKDKEGGNIS